MSKEWWGRSLKGAAPTTEGSASKHAEATNILFSDIGISVGDIFFVLKMPACLKKTGLNASKCVCAELEVQVAKCDHD